MPDATAKQKRRNFKNQKTLFAVAKKVVRKGRKKFCTLRTFSRLEETLVHSLSLPLFPI